MPASDLLDVPLSEQERRVLLGGVVEWGGPARCTEEFAVAMGFHSVANLFETSKRLSTALKERKSLSQVDWVRVLLMTEIVFAAMLSDQGGTGDTPSGFRTRRQSPCCEAHRERSRRQGSLGWSSVPSCRLAWPLVLPHSSTRGPGASPVTQHPQKAVSRSYRSSEWDV